MKDKLFQAQPIKFLIGVGGIYTSYIIYGLLVEKLFKHDYSGLNRSEGSYEKFKFAFAPLIVQNLFSFLVALLVNRFYYNQKKSSMDLKSELIISGCNFWSVFLASQALAHISFPIQALMKSSKVISLLIVSLLLRSKQKYSLSQYICGFTITFGIVLFYLTDEKKKSADGDTSIVGLILIICSLFCDGLLGTKQTEVKKQFNPSAWDQMESINKWSGILCLVVALVSLQMEKFFFYVLEYPMVIKDLVTVAFLGTIGQIFIFYTIFNFSPLILNIVTTTRKFITVLASVLFYDHTFGLYQWISVGLVFTGVFVEMYSGNKHKRSESAKPAEKSTPIKAE